MSKYCELGNREWAESPRMQMFRGEAFIDAHMDRHHALEVNPEATACLADLCGALHCDYFSAIQKGSTQHLAHAPCHPGTMEKHKAKCQDMAHACFPPDGGAAAEELHAFMLTTLCAAVTCRWSECASARQAAKADSLVCSSLMSSSLASSMSLSSTGV